jgi:hypothetical protein
MGPACLGEGQNGDLLRQLRLRLKQELRTKSIASFWRDVYF